MWTLKKAIEATLGGSDVGYPGWKVVAMGAAILFCVFGATSTMPLMYQEVMHEFGWTRTQATLIYSYQSITSAVVALALLGPLVERFGVKAMLVAALVAEGVGMASFLIIENLWTYYLAGILIGLGHGAVVITVKLLVARWFIRTLALAGGIAVIGSSIAGITFPIIMSQLIGEFGWRIAFASISLGVFAVAVPMALLARATPTEEDLLPEAASGGRAPASADALRAAELEFSYKGLLAQPTFWLIIGAIILTAIVLQGLYQHTALYLTHEVGLSRTVAATALSVTFAVGILAKFAAGRFFDAFSIRGIAIWYSMLAAVVLLAFPIQGLITAFIFAIGRGFVQGGIVIQSPVITKHVFGPKAMNRVLPLFTGVFTVGSAIGPVLLSIISDKASYQVGFMLFIGLALLATFLMWQVRPLYRDRVNAAAAAAPAA